MLRSNVAIHAVVITVEVLALLCCGDGCSILETVYSRVCWIDQGGCVFLDTYLKHHKVLMS